MRLSLFLAHTALLQFVAALPDDFPAICMVDPALPLKPGDVVRSHLLPQRRRCEASVVFTNPDFLPLRYGFRSLPCLGFLSAEFIIPREVPNGDANIIWKCADQSLPSCSRVTISGGTSDLDNIIFNKYGSINCLFPTATQTTLITATSGGTTITETDVLVEFSTTFPSSVDLAITLSSSNTVDGTMVSNTFSSPPSQSSNTVTSTGLLSTTDTLQIIPVTSTAAESLDPRCLSTATVTAACAGVTA
jgi:hypothetical protein